MVEENDQEIDGSDDAVKDLKSAVDRKDQEIAGLKKLVEDEKQLNKIHLKMIQELQAQLTSQSRLGLIFLSLLVIASVIMFAFA